MQSIVIESTDMRVSRWSFGTGSLHHLALASSRRRLLDEALDSGFTHFDTSPYYGYGLAEHDLGRAFRGRRDRFTVATKVGLYPRGWSSASAPGVWARKVAGKLVKTVGAPRVDWSLRQARRSLDHSLVRLRTDHVDVLFLHEPDPGVIAADEFLDWLEAERSRGRVRNFGLAGLSRSMTGWVRSGNRLAQVLQAKDSLEERQADALLDAGRRLQFTYGYLSAAPQSQDRNTVAVCLRAILARNTTGSVIVSTRRRERLRAFADAAGD